MRVLALRWFDRCSVLAVALALAGTAAVPIPALARSHAPEADAASADAERLRNLYARGQAAFDAGSYESAIEAFEEAHSISGDATLLFNISLCHDRLGNYDVALEYLDRYAEQAPEAEQADIERRRASLESRREREQREGPTSPAPSPAAAQPAETPSQPGDTTPASERLMPPVAWVLTGVGVAAFATGIGLGAASLARAGGAECENRGGTTLCTDSGADDARASRNLGLGADIAIGIGAVAAVAVIAIVGARAAKRNKARRVALSPTGAAIAGRF